MKKIYLAVAVILIAGATSASAQTLPFYDVTGQTAQCVEGVQKEVAQDMKETAAVFCKALGKSDLNTRANLAKHWERYDPSIRLQCIAEKKVTNYASLLNCIEYMVKRGPLYYPPQ
jgi:hypothetical protein